LDTEIDIDYDDLRQRIYALDQFKRRPSYHHLLLSWYDELFQRPLSYPCLHSGKLKGQKKWESDKTVLLAVEQLDEPLIHISRHALFLHTLFFPKPTQKGEKTNISGSSDAEKKANNVVSDSKDDVELEFWPPDAHVRVLYDEGEEKITWRRLQVHLAQRFGLKPEHTYAAIYKVMRQEWMELNSSHDEQAKALDGAPWNIKGPGRDTEIIAVFESSEYPLCFNNMKKWPIPPLSGKSKVVATTTIYESGPHSILPESSKNRREQQLRIEVD